MATIYHASITDASEVENPAQYTDMQTIVSNYWGAEEEEKLFPIPFWKIMQLLAASPSEQVALHVTDFNNKALVKADWEVYNDELEPLLEAATQAHEYYFVIHESVFQNIRNSLPTLGTPPINRLLIWGRLGEATINGNDFTAFFIAAKSELFDPTGSGGDGTTTGIKIPPPSN